MKIFSYIIFILITSQFNICANQYFFKHYNNTDGLSNNTIMCGLQDKLGFMWFGTKEGLSRYDGYKFKNYKYNDKNDISGNIVYNIKQDNDGLIWVATFNGICFYDPKKDIFDTLSMINSKVKGDVLNIEIDSEDNIWFATPKGIFKFNKTQNTVITYLSEEYFTPTALCITSTDKIWAASNKGFIYNYNARKNEFIKHKALDNKQNSLHPIINNILDIGQKGLLLTTNIDGMLLFDPNSGKSKSLFSKDANNDALIIWCIIEKEENEYWLGTESGIHIYNLNKGFVHNIKKQVSDPFSLSNNPVHTLIKDNEDGIWAGTLYGGLNHLPNENTYFHKYYPKNLPNALQGSIVKAFCQAPNGDIWIGTEDKGLYYYAPKSNKFTSHALNKNIYKTSHNNIQDIVPDGKNIWVSTLGNGIFLLDGINGDIKKHYHSENKKCGLTVNLITSMVKSKNGFLYVGTPYGMFRFNPSNEKFTYLTHLLKDAKHVLSFLEDINGFLWIGTYGEGIIKYDYKNEKVTKYPFYSSTFEGVKSIRITSLFEDSKNNIWYTSEGNGFGYFDEQKKLFIQAEMKKDEDYSITCGILEDGKNNLWISTTNGLIEYKPEKNKTTVYKLENGLLENHFIYNSTYINKTGEMYMGTVKGFISFNPSEFKSRDKNLPTYITGLEINGKKIKKLSKSLLHTSKIKLKYTATSLSFDFVAPSFTNPDILEYRYKLEGIDNDWQKLSQNRRVYYTNLKPGKYTFKVTCSKDDGWSKKRASLKIQISPPFWSSIPAIIFYCTLGVSLLFILFKKSRKKTKREEKRRIDKIETEKEKELLNSKIDFFTNITHEVRTPLTLIKSPLDRIIESGDCNPTVSKNLMIMKRNTDRLLELTNQLLEFRKAENHMFRLNFEKINVNETILSTFNLFKQVATERKINIKLQIPEKTYEIHLDKESLIKILSNLITNALKFAMDEVVVSLEEQSTDDSNIIIRVNSNGNIIPKIISEKIFEPFFQNDDDEINFTYKGTGLGLPLARSLAELNHGKLYLDTNNTEQNSFAFEIPTNLHEKVIVSTNENTAENKNKNAPTEIATEENIIVDTTRPFILVVEDEKDLCNFIASELSVQYNIIKAYNGTEAIKVLEKQTINIVVSDILMPLMDGFELCKTIKENINYSHIPVILLTATINQHAKIEGLDSGADAYIEKPFETKLLLAQISNLLKNRQLASDNFIKSPLAHVKTVAVNKTDEDFMKRLHENLVSNLASSGLSVEQIASAMDMSVSTLYRKVKGITNLNTNEYIRLFRLKKAAEMLSEGKYRINEISYLVGFSTPSYFATSFQKQFGLSPSEFIKGKKNGEG